MLWLWQEGGFAVTFGFFEIFALSFVSNKKSGMGRNRHLVLSLPKPSFLRIMSQRISVACKSRIMVWYQPFTKQWRSTYQERSDFLLEISRKKSKAVAYWELSQKGGWSGGIYREFPPTNGLVWAYRCRYFSHSLNGASYCVPKHNIHLN